MDLGLRDRVYVVTGGSRGLGRAGAAALLAEGARVVVSARDEASVARAVEELGEGAVGLVADLADPDTPDRLVGAARRELGRLDGALVSVGGPAPGRVSTTTDEQWRAAFETVFLGAARAVRVVAAELAAGDGGAIGLVLSTTAKSPITGLTTSNGLRPGLGMLVKDAADEFGPAGVRVVGLLPGRLDTDRIKETEAGDPDARARFESTIPLRRYGAPAELGCVAAFLLSPAASYVTGCLVPVDGGLLRAL